MPLCKLQSYFWNNGNRHIYYVPNVLKNIKFSWNLFQNRINQICTLQKRVHEWVQSFSVWKSANRGVKIRFHMPQKVTFWSKTLRDILWINSTRLESFGSNFRIALEFSWPQKKSMYCRSFCFASLYVSDMIRQL